MSKKKRKKPKKLRGLEVLTAILHCKGVKFRDRRKRRPKDAKNDPIKDQEL